MVNNFYTKFRESIAISNKKFNDKQRITKFIQKFHKELISEFPDYESLFWFKVNINNNFPSGLYNKLIYELVNKPNVEYYSTASSLSFNYITPEKQNQNTVQVFTWKISHNIVVSIKYKKNEDIYELCCSYDDKNYVFIDMSSEEDMFNYMLINSPLFSEYPFLKLILERSVLELLVMNTMYIKINLSNVHEFNTDPNTINKILEIFFSELKKGA